MSNNIIISDKEKAAVINFLAGEFSHNDSETLNNWLNKSANNKKLFDELSDIWNSSQAEYINRKINISKAWNDIKNEVEARNRFTVPLKYLFRYAAVFILAVFFGAFGYYFIEKNKETLLGQQTVEYVAPLGSRSFVQLADGSKVWLNAGTTLQYNNSFGTSNRNIKLQGEAFFEVAKNKKLPFVVQTSDINVIALGTRFNVKAYNQENTIETTLVEGSVKLESSTLKLADNVILKPNEKAVFTKKYQTSQITSENKTPNYTTQPKPKLEVIQSIETAPVISWKEKRWVIQNEKLGQLAIKLERRFNVNFIFDDEVLKEFYFGGTLESENLSQIMEAISYTSPIKYAIQDNTVIVMSDSKKMIKFKELLME